MPETPPVDAEPSDKSVLARKGHELRNKRHQPSAHMEIKPRRLLVGIGVGLLVLVTMGLAFEGIQKFRLRRCIPLLESTDPGTRKYGAWRAFNISVRLADRPTTRAIVQALPALSFVDREMILTHLSYWEGAALAEEDVPIIAQSLASPLDAEVARAAQLLEHMGPRAVSALPALEGALKTYGSREGLAGDDIKRAIASVKGKPLPLEAGVPAAGSDSR